MYIVFAVVVCALVFTIVMLALFLPKPQRIPPVTANLEIAAGSAMSGLVSNRNAFTAITQVGPPLAKMDGGSGQGQHVSVSFDGSTIASSGNGVVIIFNGDGSYNTTIVVYSYLSTIQAELSSDGNVCVVTCYHNNNYDNPRIYRRKNAKSDYEFESGGSGPVYSVAISYDGNTVAYGSFGTDGWVGVLVYNGSAWIEHARLVASNQLGTGIEQGTLVRLSGDGNTLISSRSNNDNNNGCVWTFNRSRQNTWYETGKLVAPYITNGNQGNHIAISGDGMALMFTATPIDISNTGIAYVYIFDGNQWVLFPGMQDLYTAPYDGPICISHNGMMFGVTRGGSVYIYTSDRVSPFTLKTTVSVDGLTIDSQFGSALSMNENTLIVGAQTNNYGQGAIVRYNII